MIAKDEDWQSIAKAYRAQADAKIPKSWRISQSITESISPSSSQSVLDIPRTCGILSDDELDITENYDAAVTQAFCKRAAIAQQLTFCLTETFFDQAIARAQLCDEYLVREGKPIGPFHGLPISIKDSFNVKGINSTLGFVSFVDRPPASNNSALVEILVSLGAVLYVKTNVPQTLMTADSDNNLFGRTLNPNRLNLTAGGSSGGEGALIALRGSVLGVGTDIAGSIRIPAFCNGTIGFKPTNRRIPYGGQTAASRPGGFGILPCAGPLCHSIRDAEYFMKNILAFDTWSLDEGAILAPWRSVSTQTYLRLGLILEDEEYPLHPPGLRSMQTAVSKLSSAGHQVIPLASEMPSKTLAEANRTAFKFFSMDNTKFSMSHIARSGEPVIPSIPKTLPAELRSFEPTLDDVWDLNVRSRQFAADFRRLVVEKRLDAIVMPAYQSTAQPHDTYGSPPYTVLANLIDYPSCVVPFGKADKALDADFVRNVPYTPEYNPDVVEGAPHGIQVMGTTMRDEECLKNAQAVYDVLRA